MKHLTKFSTITFSKNRLETFSDGVFAIIITLLVLEIKVPHIAEPITTKTLMAEMVKLLPKIISWIISFLVIGIWWLQHHNLLLMARRIDYAVVWMNILMLMAACFVPFPTALMGEYPHHRFAVQMLGMVMVPGTFWIICLYYYITKNHLSENYVKEKVMRNVKISFYAAPALYAAALLLSFLNVYITYFIYLLIPVFFMLPLDEPIQKNMDEL